MGLHAIALMGKLSNVEQQMLECVRMVHKHVQTEHGEVVWGR